MKNDKSISVYEEQSEFSRKFDGSMTNSPESFNIVRKYLKQFIEDHKQNNIRKQIIIGPGYRYLPKSSSIEIAYNKECIKIYTGDNHGCIVPEFIDINPKSPQWNEFYELLDRLLHVCFLF